MSQTAAPSLNQPLLCLCSGDFFVSSFKFLSGLDRLLYSRVTRGQRCCVTGELHHVSFLRNHFGESEVTLCDVIKAVCGVFIPVSRI